MAANQSAVGFRVLRTPPAGPPRPGDPGDERDRLETAWVVESPLGVEHSLEERLEALLDELDPDLAGLHQLADGSLMHVFVGRDAIAHQGRSSLLGPTVLERLSTLPGEGLLIEAA